MPTVYVAEEIETSLAEMMYYFHREVIMALDTLHLGQIGNLPPFERNYVLWEIKFKSGIDDIYDLDHPNAASYHDIFPTLLYNPSHDYHHLKEKRDKIELSQYKGLRAPSSRNVNDGFMLVIFSDQSDNIAKIKPYDIDFRLIKRSQDDPFISHASDILNFTAGQVRFPKAVPPSSPWPGNDWVTVNFHH